MVIYMGLGLLVIGIIVLGWFTMKSEDDGSE